METPKHRYPIKILKSHLDAYGHVNNAVYLVLFEKARLALITANKHTSEKIEDFGLGPAILEVHVKFKKELRLDQNVIIETYIQPFRKKIAIIHQEILDDQGTLYTLADFTFGIFDIRARKLVNPTKELLEDLGISSFITTEAQL